MEETELLLIFHHILVEVEVVLEVLVAMVLQDQMEETEVLVHLVQ